MQQASLSFNKNVPQCVNHVAMVHPVPKKEFLPLVVFEEQLNPNEWQLHTPDPAGPVCLPTQTIWITGQTSGKQTEMP